MSNIRTLARLIDRLEEFLDEFKTELEADEVSTVDDTISVIDRLKSHLDSQTEDDDEGES